MITINEVDESLIEKSQQIVEIAKNLEFQSICEFTPKTSKTDIPWEKLMHSGVYLIEVKTDFENLNYLDWLNPFKNDWESEKYKKQFTPNFSKKRISSHTKLLEWMPLYIGKSKKISSRVNDHLFKDLNKPTFAMKLYSRENLNSVVFRLSTIKIEVKNYNMILPKIEAQLREKINPLIGRQ